MSTKTTFKRIALVAVASMGFGLLSAAPSSAGADATTATFTNATSPTTNPVVGSAVILPVDMAVSGTQDATATATLTATLSVRPTNSALTAQSTAISIDTYAAAHTAGGNTGTKADAVAGVSGAALTVALANANQDTTGEVARFSFTPDTAGYYEVTLTKGGTATTVLTNLIVGITVRGGSLVQAGSGLGTSSGTQVVGRQSAAVFALPAGTATTDRFKLSITGGSIVGVFNNTTLQDAVNASSYTGVTGLLKNNGITFADGVTVTPQRAVTVPTGVATTRAGGNTNDAIIVQFDSAVAGNATVLLQSINVTTGILTTVGSVLVTYGAVPAVSASLSRAYAGQGNTHPAAAETAALSVPSTASVAMTATATTGVTIAVDVLDTAGNALVAQAITATITGAGLLTLANDAAGNATGSTGTVRTASLTATTMASSSSAIIGISADGTRGVGTVTITAGGVTIATKTITFYGAVASLTATQNYSIARSGRTVTSDAADYTLGSSTAANTGLTVATSPAVSIVAKDVDGNVVPGATVSAVIADSLVLGTATVTSCAGGAVDTICEDGAGYFIANVVSAIGGVSGASTTVTFRTPHPTVAGTFITATPVTFTLGGSKTGGTVTMTLDKATYEPGERMILTIVAKDASGNPVYTGTATGTPSANKNVTGLTSSSFLTGTWILGDGATEFLYAPTAPGAFTVTLATGTSTTATITATATVVDDAATVASSAAADAAAEATDAANAATDAANAAAEAADAATAAAQDAADAVAALSASVSEMVNALKKQITSLTNLVIKIQKKVKA